MIRPSQDFLYLTLLLSVKGCAINNEGLLNKTYIKTSDIECNFSVELTFEYSLLPVGGNFSQIKRSSAEILLRNKYYCQIIFEFAFNFLAPYDFTIFSTSYFTLRLISSRINVS